MIYTYIYIYKFLDSNIEAEMQNMDINKKEAPCNNVLQQQIEEMKEIIRQQQQQIQYLLQHKKEHEEDEEEEGGGKINEQQEEDVMNKINNGKLLFLFQFL